jgi:ribokinase
MSSVYVLGNASLDISLRVPRLPMPGETLMAHGITRAPGGKGLNQAVVVARADVPTHFCAAIGNEPEAEMIWSALAAEHLSGLQLFDGGQPTDVSTLLVDGGGENCIISTGDCADALSAEVAAEFCAPMRRDDILLVQGNLTEAATFAAVSRAGRVVMNTAPVRWTSARVFAECAVVIANRTEAAQVTGLADPTQAVQALGGAVGIVTLGPGGCLVADAAGVTHYPAVRVDAVDSTGAGDAFCGVFAAALARRLPLGRAVEVAQYAAALTVERAGCFAALPTREELAVILGQ